MPIGIKLGTYLGAGGKVTPNPLATSINAKVTCYWKLEEADGNRADSKGGQTLSEPGSSSNATGKVGQALHLQRSLSEYLSRASEATLQTGDIDFTLAAWVYLDSKPAAIMWAFSKATNVSTAAEYRLMWDNVSDRFIFAIGGAGFISVTANNFGAPSLATWAFVVVWHDAAADTINIQVNNGTANSFATAGQVIPTTAASFRIGYLEEASARYWDGRIDEVLFATAVLTAAERTFLYNNGMGRTYPF